MNPLHFLLTPDRASARRVRRATAEREPRLGVIVGAWTELVEHARRAYLLPAADDQWREELAEAAAGMKEAFWAKSLDVAKDETLASLGSSLAMLIEGAGPKGAVAPDTKNILPERARRHLTDLALLHEKMGRVLPPRLAALRTLLDAPASEALRSIAVYHIESLPRLSAWQKAVIEKIEQDFPSAREKELQALLSETLASAPSKKRPRALAAVQDSLFEPAAAPVKLDNSLQWLAVRDYLEEAEVAAGMVQEALKQDKTLKPSDVGLLLPADRDYARAVQDAFTLAGLPLSGLRLDQPVRDLGKEAVLHFLLCRRPPAPAMALASLLTSPLMPWDPQQGHAYAAQMMNGDYDFTTENLTVAGRRMIALIRESDDSPGQLAGALQKFVQLLADPEDGEDHRERAAEAADAIAVVLRAAPGEVPWKQLLAIASPSALPGREENELSREGVTVLAEDEEPWRPVRHLLVLGFASGRYPESPPRSSVFSESDLSLLADELHYDIETGADVTARRRKLFRRQLGAASEFSTFLVPKRDALGAALQPSDSLAFMARLVAGSDDPVALLVDLDREAGRKAARGIAFARAAKPRPPLSMVKEDLSLGQDLLILRKYDDGSPKPESPSSIETFMISPLGWFLDRHGLTPQEWAVEELDPAAKGTLSHEVFERLFRPDATLPDETEIRKQVPGLLNQAAIRLKPMLLAREWQVEYRHLEGEIVEAALWWRSFLEQTGAAIAGAEVWLTGKLGDLPIHGKTDALLSLPQGRLLIADYKKSTSRKRRDQMRKGFDSQANLYRTMLRTGGVSQRGDQKTGAAVKEAREIGVLYYMMNDQTVLADTASWIGRDIAGVEEMGQHISDNAMKLIDERIRELRKGIIMLNREGDEKRINKDTGMTATYALDKSPLVKLFLKEEEEVAE